MKVEFSKIKFIVFDFDGVFTDNSVIVDQNGREAVVCNRSDGIGLSRLKEIGVESMILSAEKNEVINRRAEKLDIYCVNKSKNKFIQLKKEINKRKISPEKVAYVGNDINDIECLKLVGLPIVVANAHKDVIKFGKYKTKLGGGQGAVREICDLIHSAKKSD